MYPYPVLGRMLKGINLIRSGKVKIGVVGLMRNVFQQEYGKGRYAEFLAEIAKDDRVDVFIPDTEDGIIYAGQLDETQDAVNMFLGEKIDGLIVIAINYGDEEAAAKIGKAVHDALKVPIYTYIWPDAPVQEDGTRLSDNECGILPMRQHMRVSMGINPGAFPFCDIGTDKFLEAWDGFVRICSGIHSARSVRMLQIGAEEPTFYAIQANPDDLRRKFGFRAETIELWTLIKFVTEGLETPPEWFEALHEEILGILDFAATVGNFPQLSAKLTLTLGWIVEQLKEKQSNCISIRCWEELFEALGMMVCPLNGILYSMGVMAPCETDKPGAIASALLHGLGIGDDKDLNIFADLTRWDHGKPLWWHCGPFPACGARDCDKLPLQEGWIIEVPSAGLGNGPWGEIGDIITFAQFRPNVNGDLQLTVTNGEICDGPPTIGTHFYTEMARPGVAWKFMMDNAVDHHHSGRIGDFLELIEELEPWLGLDTVGMFLDNL